MRTVLKLYAAGSRLVNESVVSTAELMVLMVVNLEIALKRRRGPSLCAGRFPDWEKKLEYKLPETEFDRHS